MPIRGPIPTPIDTVTVDLFECVVVTPAGERIRFDIDPQRKNSLIEGLDDISLTLKSVDQIRQWQTRDHLERPWIWSPGPA
jgi:3-isopropylmalate/(R)-2-methylmalate dehydratase small subunit